MEIGEAIARASVWFALCCYPAGPFGPVVSTARGKRVARFVWTAGCVAFAAHVVASFGAFYEWSHLVALDETRRRSAAVTGIDSGLGLYLNYLFGLLWMLDAAWWWSDDEAYGRRSRRGLLLFHAFFLFMIVNATVLFDDGAARLAGATITLCGAAGLWLALHRSGDRR